MIKVGKNNEKKKEKMEKEEGKEGKETILRLSWFLMSWEIYRKCAKSSERMRALSSLHISVSDR